MSEVKVMPPAAEPIAAAEVAPRRRVPGISVGLLFCLALITFLVYDFSDFLMAQPHRRTALKKMSTGARLTQAERELNEAGYVTLYGEGPPAFLQVSTLRQWPLTMRLLGVVLPRGELLKSIENNLTSRTRFYLVADDNGRVKVNEEGTPRIIYQAPEVKPMERF